MANNVINFQQLHDRAIANSKIKIQKGVIAGSLTRETYNSCRKIENDKIADIEYFLDKESDDFSLTENVNKFPDSSIALQRAIESLENKKGDFLITSGISPSQLLAFLFHQNSDFYNKKKTVCHVSVMKPEKYHKLLLVSDGAVNVQPDLMVKLGIINSVSLFANSLGISRPKMAIVGAVEVIYPQMPATIDGAILAKMSERGQIKNAIVDGPLSFDVAVDRIAAEAKGIKNSEVAGDTDVIIAPNIEVANGINAAMALYGFCELGKIIYGGKYPVVLLTPADSESTCLNSIMLAALAV